MRAAACVGTKAVSFCHHITGPKAGDLGNVAGSFMCHVALLLFVTEEEQLHKWSWNVRYGTFYAVLTRFESNDG